MGWGDKGGRSRPDEIVKNRVIKLLLRAIMFSSMSLLFFHFPGERFFMHYSEISKFGRIFPALCLGAAIFLGGALVFPVSAGAEKGADAAAVVPSSAPVDILPASAAQGHGVAYDFNEITHPEILMTPDKSDLVRLEKPAASVIVGNPAHLNVMADTSKILVLVPREPGATYFTVLGRDGEVLMQRHVIVAAPKEKYIRVRRSCAGTDAESCERTSVFYCPDMCHRILAAEQDEGDGGVSAARAVADTPGNGAGNTADE